MMLTVRDVKEDLIEAFDSGADDYVCSGLRSCRNELMRYHPASLRLSLFT
jgi:PleD family two-component response regulator